MSKNGVTGLRESLVLLYGNYGGLGSLVRSEYFWVSVCFTGLCWPIAFSGKWTDIGISVLPSLAGFSIAAFAIFFSVLDDKARSALRAPSASLGNRSPLLVLASSISHAVLVQILALLATIVIIARPIPVFQNVLWLEHWIRVIASSFGLFLLIYGISLVLAAVLSIFRILDITTRSAK